MSKLLQSLVLAMLLITGLSAYASVTPSPAMIEQFRQLPRAEQERLARQYGIDLQVLERRQQLQNQTTDRAVTEPQPVTQRPRGESLAAKERPNRFGLSLFETEASDFRSGVSVPVPQNYIIGPDDQILVQLFGKQFNEYLLVVNRDGSISIPEIGSVQLSGLTFREARELITGRVSSRLIGVQAAVSMGELRGIQVFVAGEAKYPGRYTISALSSALQALFAAGGVSDIGSLREIWVNRQGERIAQLDLYDLLLNGDSRNDIALQSGDVVFVAPVKKLAEVQGLVRRPAIFEVNPGETLADLLRMAGGVREGAFPQASILERFNQQNLRDFQNIDLTHAHALQTLVQAGDVLRIGATSPRVSNSITVAGAVVRPGVYAWREGIRVNDMIRSVWSDVLDTTDLSYALVVRTINAMGDIEIVQFDLAQAIHQPDSSDNLELQPQDKILVFHLDQQTYKRTELNEYIRESLGPQFFTPEELRWLATDQLAHNAFGLLYEGSEPERNTSQWMLLQQGNEQAIAQRKASQLKERQQEALKDFMTLFLNDVLRDPELLPKTKHLTRTELLYPVMQQVRSQHNSVAGTSWVSIQGEVKVPGDYPLARNASVRSLIAAAGGLKNSAYPSRLELTRHHKSYNGSTSGVLQHLSLDLTNEADANALLQPRDQLSIFATPGWGDQRVIELFGEVRFPGSYMIQQGETLLDVINRAGGFTEQAFARGAIFTRNHLRERETHQLKKLVEQLRTEIATRSLAVERPMASPQDMITMITQIEMQDTVGRLVINLPELLAGNTRHDLVLEDGDKLYIPRVDSSISIMGEVQHASSHRFQPELTLDEYLQLAGGLRQRADGKRVYVVRADGSVVIPSRGWLRGRSTTLQPGDTIVVPLNTEYTSTLSLWTQVTQIFYQSAVALAAISRI